MEVQEGTMIYTLGYGRSGSMAFLVRLVERLPLMVVDIRFSAYSRFMPDFRQGSLKERFKDRYLHVRDLGNLNYRDHSLPIEIANPKEGVRVVSEFLLTGWSVCLLCTCPRVERCHRRVVAGLLVEECPLFGVQHFSLVGGA